MSNLHIKVLLFALWLTGWVGGYFLYPSLHPDPFAGWNIFAPCDAGKSVVYSASTKLFHCEIP
jgi:hypothetical protein